MRLLAAMLRTILDTLNPRLRLPRSATFDHAEGNWEFDRPVARGVRVSTHVSFAGMDAGLRRRAFVA